MVSAVGARINSNSPRTGGAKTSPSLAMVGTSFRTAKIDSRERIAARLSKLREAGDQFGDRGVLESSVVATCNRLEVYLACNNPEGAVTSVIKGLEGAGTMSGDFYVKTGGDAIRHIFRVAAGLDSLVLGEEQILQQVREAGKTARVSGQAKSILSSLFDAAYSSGTRVRESYKASTANRSVSAFAFGRALKELGRKPARVLLIGSGETAKLAALELKGTAIYLLTGRRDTSARFPNAMRISRARLREVSGKCDLIIAATRHRGYVLTKRDLPERRRMVVLDLGFPRNIDPALKDSKFVRLYDLDDIASWAVSLKGGNLASAEMLVEEEAQRFTAWLTASRLTPTLATIYKWAERIRDEETVSALRRLPKLSAREKTVVETMSKRLTGKLMAPHATFVKELGSETNQTERLRLLESIFSEGRR